MVIGNNGKPVVDPHQKMAIDTSGKSIPVSLLMNGQTARLKPVKEKKRKKKRVCRVGNLFRIALWYFIFTGLYCPSTITEDSSRACKAYLQITNFVVPTIEPYFEKYATPYLEPVRPYYMTVQKRFVRPVSNLGRKYGRPLLLKAIALGKSYWLKYVHPQTEKYFDTAYQYYREKLGPCMDDANKIVNSYYEEVKLNTLSAYSEIIISYYNAVKPQVVKSYVLTQNVFTNNVYPWVKWTLTNGEYFLIKTVWPKLKSLYSESVEPQLKKIGERLDKYRNRRKNKSTNNEFKSTSRYSASQTSSQVTKDNEDSLSLSTTLNVQKSDSSASTDKKDSKISVREKAQEMVTRDLKEWQEKYSNAADEAADEIENYVTEITDKFISQQVEGVGNILIQELEEIVKVGLEKLKSNILATIRESHDANDAREAVSVNVRTTGIIVKEKALSLRAWRQVHSKQLDDHVSKKISETLEILDTIKNAGLQEVGMRWAWTDGVTYKHWVKYHDMKSKFSKWREEVELFAVEHPKLKIAHAKILEIEMQALGVAENTAKDLTSLKEIGLWKISVKDTNDNFDTTILTSTIATKTQELGKANDSKDTILLSTDSYLGDVTSSAQKIEVPTPTSASHRAEGNVIFDSTIHQADKSDFQSNEESNFGDFVFDKKHIPQVTIGDDDQFSSDTNIISVQSSATLEMNNLLEPSTKFSVTGSFLVTPEPSTISSL